ncbi:tripartite tricarboxylate transporter substrate binding protein [Variovorax sp. J31P207]|uniref:Bug family tripartite tricarboxylate transporter substrate binding protein n=1 Tax=Variovorax sp. J31P207 TaxID=3053510 RepID=UPI002575A3B3|nr:tripartite tricarboxylate transporter substrate binding protein [Variovorax sp. J31P207]MDM0064958.1 tripartite tricarboxylate transporter substrate binding protein [Variovorax sp. J31P207]
MNRREIVTLLAGGCLSAAVLPSRAAAGYPTRPVKVVVPFTAGGGTDVVARALASGLSEGFGRTFIVENRPGASTVIGSEYVAGSPPDGYTLLLASVPHVTNPWLMKALPFDTLKAFAPISLAVQSPFIMVTSPASPVRSLADVLALAKTRRLAFASTGSGTADHLAMELLALDAGISMTHAPYKGTGPALSDVMGGHVDLMFANVVAAAPLVKSGKLRALATSTQQRSPSLPDVPTVAEITGKAFDVSAWAGLLAPAGTDASIVERLGAEVRKALQTKATREALVSNGADPVGSTPAEFRAFIAREMDTWGAIIKKADITTS